MRQIRSKQIVLSNGQVATVSAALIEVDEYEVMTFLKNGDEVGSARVSSEEEALKQFDIQVEKFTGEPCGKYAKLAEDIQAAMQYAVAFVAGDEDDGGTCNFDAPCLSLPRWNKIRVEHAAKHAKSSCFYWSAGGYVISMPHVGQGNRRTKAAEAACSYFKQLGYDAGMYYQMD